MRKVDLKKERRLLRDQLSREGIRDERVLAAIGSVPRERFLPPEMEEFAYRDAPLPIGQGQTISQPFIVAYMAQALELEPTHRVLEIGAGSGYAAAILAELAAEVFTVERYKDLADSARQRLRDLGYENIKVRHGDGTEGWIEHAPYDAIAVAAGGPQVPQSLREQLKIGGHLVIPVGEHTPQRLMRVTRVAEDEYQERDLGAVAFVPLIGAEGWTAEQLEETGRASGTSTTKTRPISTLIRECAQPFESIEDCDLTALLDRIGNARLVLIGEATHGTSEFYRMRAKITKALIRERGFSFVAVEADWPDAARIHRHVHGHRDPAGRTWEAFARFPTWMWRNREVLEFIQWQRDYNLAQRDVTQRTGFYGLDLYNLAASIAAVLEYLDRVDPAAAQVARHRYGCLTPWERDPATYGRIAITQSYRSCEDDVVSTLRDLLARQAKYAQQDGEQFMDAALNARLVANAEKYYRVMYYGSIESWNLRDRHMFETLESLLDFHGPDSKAILWAHNSHLGNAAATQMGDSGEFNVGQLCREKFGDSAYLIGQATDHGTVAAASMWDAPMEIKDVRPAIANSYEKLCHETKLPAFMLPLRQPMRSELRDELMPQRLERAIGVIYRPDTERQSHYFNATLPQQFDELIWFDQTKAVAALSRKETSVHPAEHPFATID